MGMRREERNIEERRERLEISHPCTPLQAAGAAIRLSNMKPVDDGDLRTLASLLVLGSDGSCTCISGVQTMLPLEEKRKRNFQGRGERAWHG